MEKPFTTHLLILFLFIGQVAQAQVRFGVKLGANAASAYVPSSEFRDYFLKTEGSSLQNHYFIQGGLTADIGLGSHFSIQPSLLLSPKGFKSVELLRGGIAGSVFDTARISAKIQYLEIPLLVQYQFNIGGASHLFVSAGPYGGLGLKGTFRDETRTDFGRYHQVFRVSPDKNYNRIDYGGKIALGLAVRNVSLEINYSQGLADLGKFNYKTYNRTLALTAGYRFGK